MLAMEYWFFTGAILLFITLVMFKGWLDSKKAQKKFIKKLYEQYGSEIERKYKPGELEQHIPMYYKKHTRPHQIDDITWNDLDMDEIYRNMNYSHSLAGDEYLYYRLRTPIQDKESLDELDKFEQQVLFFMRHDKERVELQFQFAQLGRMGRYSLYEYLEYLETLGDRSSLKYYFSILLIIVSLAVMYFSTSIGICLLLVVLSRNMINYYKEQKEIEPYITSFRYISRLLDSAASIARQPIDEIAKEREELLSCYKTMGSFRRNSFILFSGSSGGSGMSASSNILDMIMDYLRMTFYLDLIKFNQMLGKVRVHTSEIDKIVTLLGMIETAIVVGEYRTSLEGDYCIPEFIDGDDASCSLNIEQLYHPLLNDPVKNDIAVNKGVLLTGSNASGKSTFLRAAALNVIMAQCIHTCTAVSYKGNIFQIYSSMSLKDDLMSGDSYYMAEVKSIRRILNEVEEAQKDKKQVICFVDEVLRGTNTVERIVASTQILKALAADNVMCFAATHDLELTKLLNEVYDNYHFEEEIVEDDIFFPYRLQKGAAVSRNAIALLKVLGYDKTIVEDAEAMAESFLSTGKWRNNT